MVLSFSIGFGQTTNLTFTKIPTSDPDIIKPGAGPEYWIYQSTVRYPNANSPEDNSLDRYDRFEWRSFENGAQGVYNWTEFDNSINTAISKRQKFSFGIMTYCESCSDFRTSVGGADLTSYPPYLHNLMQAEATNSRDWVANGTWIPNYNSPNYLDRHRALLNALAAHIASTSFNGVPYSRIIRYIDVRGIGNYNEWHHYGYLDQIPTGRFPTVATYKRVVDDYISAFPNYQLVALSDGYDPSGSSNTPPEVISYLLSAKNNVGKLGYRRDNIGSGYLWVNSKLENNPAVYNGVNLKDSIMTRWKTAPLVGEAMNCCSVDGGNQPYFDLSRQITFYHINSMGNGNFENGTSSVTQNAFRAAGKLMGFRYLTESGSMATTITRGVPFNITLGWKNEGNSPTYERWFIDFTLRNSTTNAIVWTGTSRYNLKALLPLTTATNINESFTVPTSVAAGTYRLHMTVRDSSGYRNPMPLFMTGVQSDGSYILRSAVTVSATGGNIAPVANAGADRTITLPTSSVTLSGSGTDADGTISSYGWSKVSGTGGTIVSAAAASTNVTGLTAGTYVYRLTVTDNTGATATDDVQITVIAAAPPSPPNAPPFANAGSDQTVTLPANTATLNGSANDPDGSIATYAWTKLSGPAGGTLQTPNAAGSNVTALIAGTYVFRLTVTDNDGATHTDDVQIIVNSAPLPPPNQAPTANAGPDQVITLPVNTTTLNGNGTDPDGTIASYAWTKVSGPAGGAISSANTASTGITGLNAGVYVYRLTVRDNNNATATNTIQVTVNNAPLPPNQAPTANAGTDQVITLPVNTTTLNGSGTDPDGTIASFVWSKVSGPAGGTITSANTASTGITGLVAGVYVFRLTVTDNRAATAANTIQVTVNSAPALAPAPNAAPTANAGPDRNITLPVNTTTVNGSGADTDGTIATYAWTKVSGPAGGNLQSPAAASTNITGLNAGTYVFRLTVTDNDGATATDNVSVIVSASLAPSPSNQAPVANAGNNIIITLPVNTASLTGSGTDADGSVATYNWTKLSGPTGGNIQSTNTASTNITSLIAGTYVYRLTVTDNAGAQSSDDVQVTVNPAPAPVGNQAPIANAGTNRSITLPTNSVSFTGSGTDPDGTIATYSWSKVSGPAGGTIQTPNAATTNITGLTAGTYVFRLTVTDNGGASASDEIQLIVNAAPVLPNQAPIANAGRDISLTLPVDSTILNGSASTDPDGSIVSYAWRKVQGPNSSSLINDNKVAANASGLTRGVHEYELTVTDNRGGTSTDRVLVTVIRINQRPLALTTRDTINVTLPVQNTELNAASSYDPDGTISNYQWTYTRGPKEPKVLAPTAPKTVVTDLVAGTYSFNLVVTDNDGDKTSKSVVVIVSNSSSRRQVPDVSIYPNPATGLVNVKINTPVEGRTTLTFVDMNGRPVMTDSFVKGFSTFTRQVNISGLPKGTYAIIIQVDQTEKVIEKVIKF